MPVPSPHQEHRPAPAPAPSSSTGPQLSPADLKKQELRAQGVAVAAWAQEHGFARDLVYAVINGRRKCLRGQSHAIAVALGLKPRDVASERTP